MQCFLAAARFRNFRLASNSLALTPAALSKRIQQLEDQLGKKLFNRTTRKVVLTKAGYDLVPVAHKLIQIVLTWLLPFSNHLNQTDPNLQIDAYAGAGPELENQLKNFQVDCVMVSRHVTDKTIETIPLFFMDFCMAASPSLLEETAFDAPEDSKKHCLIDVDEGLPLFHFFKEAPHAPTIINFKKYHLISSVLAIKQLLVDGKGIAVMPESQIARELRSGELVKIFPDLQLLKDQNRLLYRKDDPRASFFQTLAKKIIGYPIKL